MRFVEEAPIKRHATNVTAPFPARVEGGIEGYGRWKQCWEHRLKRKGGEELRVAKNRGRREKGGQITKMGYIETWTKRRGGGLDKRRGGEKMKLCTLVSVYKVAEQ